MKLLSLVIALVFSFGVVHAKKVYLLKQWHLSPKILTQDIEASRKLPQYKNQQDLYLKILNLFHENPGMYLLAEGCEGKEIRDDFNKEFNGWSYKRLLIATNDKSYDDILTHIPLKVEVKLNSKIMTLCADQERYIEETQLALSDVRAYMGYLLRLQEFKTKRDQVSFEKYSQSMLKDKKIDPITYARNQANKALDRFEKYTDLRNKNFVEVILKLKEPQVMALVVGGLHALEIKKTLEEKKYDVEVYEPVEYGIDKEAELIKDLRKRLL